MSKLFNLEILTPGRVLLTAEVSEVLLPAFDGERGILANHENFVGLLGIGAVKIVRDSNDYWFMVSSGVYQVKNGDLTIFAELAEKATEIDSSQSLGAIKEYEDVVNNPQKYTPEFFEKNNIAYQRNQARLEVHRRTELLN